MDDVVKEFLIESRDSLDQLDLDLVELEDDPTRRETLASVFRTVHTIKGTCGFFGFSKLEQLTHAGETLLGRLRDGDLVLTPEMTTALLALGDGVRAMLAQIEQSGVEGDADYSALASRIDRLQQGSADTAESPVAAGGSPLAPPPERDDSHAEAPAATAEPEPAAAVVDTRSPVADASVRVDVSLLDTLMNQVGELVLARNQILQYSASHHDPVLMATTQRLNQITSELQEGVMKTRMQQIGSVWSKFPRVVRDLSRQLGKEVALEMNGEDTELDRTIIEAIKDPLTHIVRNAVDHGIEMPAERVAAGKSSEGTLRLHAFHEGGQVNIEIADDGAGIDPERIKAKAIEKRLITPEQATRMSDREALHLVFLPGFSTAKAVTNISGRGVGMDVVKTNIEKIGGSLDLHSEPGSGTTLRIKIPLTLAIIPALIVTCGGDNYAIPQVCLLELVRLEGEQAAQAIEMILDVPVYRLRGDLLSMTWLNEQLGVGTREDRKDAALNIAVLQADDLQFGLVVDEISDNQEIVVKPLGKLLKDLTCYAGATIMGDGRVALILDAMGIAMRAGVVAASRERKRKEVATAAVEDGQGERTTLLLFTAGDDTPKAVQLSHVARLEEFAQAALERAGGQCVVQYRDDIMPLIRLADLLGTADRAPSGQPLQVIAHNVANGTVGIVVDRILDIVEERVTLRRTGTKAPLAGTAVIHGKVTEIVDIEQVVHLAGLDETPALAGR